MDELKNTIVTVEQGGLNLDDSVNSIPDGDSLSTTNVVFHENGTAEGILGYEKVFTSQTWEIIYISTCDEDGNVFVLSKISGDSKPYKIYKNATLIYEDTDQLIDDNSGVQMVVRDGYIFITQSTREPLMISINNVTAFTSKNALYGVCGKSNDNKLLFTINTIDYSSTLQVGDTASTVCSPMETDLGGKSGTGEILDIATNLLTTTVKIDVDITDTGSGMGYLLDGTSTFYPFIENLTTIKPTPQKPPSITMTTDGNIGYNNFIEHNYVFGYSFIYDDNYETPISPLSVVDLSSIEQAVKNRNGVTDLNKAQIYINPYPSVSKVKIYSKKDSESESFYLIDTVDYRSEIIYEWDGSLVENVLANEVWVKGSESIPIHANVMEYLPDNSIIYAGCTEGHDELDIKISTGFNQVNTDVTNDSTATYSATTTLDGDNIIIAFNVALPWSSAPNAGRITLVIVTLYSGGRGTSTFTINAYYETNDDQGTIADSIIEEFNKRYGSYLVASRYPSVSGDYILINPTSTWGFTSATSEIQLTDILVVCSKSLKPDYEEQFGVVFKDRAGRSSSVITNESCNLKVSRILYNNGISVWTPKILLNGTPPPWATNYQFVVKRNLKSWTQHIIPCKYTDGTWGTTSPPDSAAIKLFSNGIYGVALNRLVTDTQDATVNPMIYQYKEGDYIKFIRYYNSIDGWWNVFGSEMYRITGSKEDSGITYYLIDDIEGSFSNIDSAYTNTFNTYLQFEIVNVGSTTLIADSIWTEIGEPYAIVSGTIIGDGSESYTYPIDGETYTFKTHNVEYGRCIIRPVFRGNLDLPSTVKEKEFYIETEYLYDSSLVKLLNTGRPYTIFKDEEVYRNIIRVGGMKFDGTKIDNRRVFDYDDYTDLGSVYGDVSYIKQRGNAIRIYCPKKTASIYLNADEVSYQDGTTNLIYNSNKLGKIRWNESKYGCSSKFHIVYSGNAIYFFDAIRKEFVADTSGGIFCISGKSGQQDYKMNTFFNLDDVRVGYDAKYRMVWVTSITYTTNRTVAFFEDYNRWKSFYTIGAGGYFNGDEQLYSYNRSGVFKHHVSGYNSYGYAGELYDSDVIYDVVVGTERQSVKNMEAVVLHSDDKYNVYLNCYTKGWDDDLYTKIPSGTFKNWEDLFYADVTKGGNESTFKSYMMYEGKDMVGKVGVFKVKGDIKISGIEVRYSVRNK